MRVVFGSIITEGHGKLGGSIIQNSYGGYQMRNLKQPFKVPSTLQQRNRVNFKTTTGGWKNLSNEDRQSWIDNAPPGVSGFQFYNSTNLILTGLGLTPLSSYTAPVTPPTINIELDAINIVDTDPKSLTLSLISGDSSIPTSTWFPYVRWTGFSPIGGTFLAPPIRIVQKEGQVVYDADSMVVRVGSAFGANMANFAYGTQAIFTVDFVNENTGQTISVYQENFLYN